MAKCLNLIDVISVLLNGGHVVRVQPVAFGRTYYRVYLPAEKFDLYCGHISEISAEKLWNMGYLVAPNASRTVGSDVLTVFKLDKPDVSRFICKSSAAADENK